MPVYNGQRYLQAALGSVLLQSFRDFELIAIDDGSTDDTPQILRACTDSRLKMRRVQHIGLIGALNAGIEQSSGVFIARMDADDLSYRDRLARQVECLSANPDLAVVTCWSELLNEAGSVIGCRTGGVSDDMLLELAAGNQIVHGSIMLRRDSLPPPPVYQKAPEDYWLWVQMARAGRRFRSVPEVHYGFRTHGERYSLSHARSQSAGIVDVQWPLLEECSRERDVTNFSVLQRLVRGWGSVAGAAYCAGDWQRADAARRRFLDLAGNAWTGPLAESVCHGVESMIWGGCPWYHAWTMRWRQWKCRPRAWASYRNLLLSLPPIRKVRSVIRRDA
jgi:glycosyltransferase involved in cell wall biosynthesis